jgi:hypothetical protein
MIFGNDKPKIVVSGETIDYGSGDDLGCLINIDYTYLKPVNVINESVLTGDRIIHKKGDYANFKLTIVSPASWSKDRFNSHYGRVYNLLKNAPTVTFYPTADLSYSVSCYVKNIKPYYHRNSIYCDAYILELESDAYVTETFTTVATPVADPASTSSTSTITVDLSCSTSGAEIRYTLDGSEPTRESTLYGLSISITSGTKTIKARAYKDGLIRSEIMSETYTIIPE